MKLKQSYYFHCILSDLVNNKNFTVLYINEGKNEFWLEGKTKKGKQVLRIIEAEFDWKNHLKSDMSEMVWRAKNIKGLLKGRNIFLHNVYIANYPPVDEWQELKKPITMKDSKFNTLQLYYLEENKKAEELIRLYDALGLNIPTIHYPETELEMEDKIESVSKQVKGTYFQYKKQVKEVFNRAKPVVSYGLVVINILMFLLLEWAGGSTSTLNLIKYGAKYNPAILDGEWWRIISSMFLHIGLLHLFMNMLALHFVGTVVERIYGTKRFTTIYFLAGIVGGLASFALSPQIAAGASGAIFGLFGALLYFGLNYRRIFFQTMGWNVIIVVIINIIFGFSIPQIDNGAHIGGLLGGFVAAAIVNVPNKKRIGQQVFSFVCYLGLVSGLIFLGINSTQISPEVQLQVAQEYIKEEKYHDVIDETNKGIRDDGNLPYQSELLFLRSYAFIKLESYDRALEDLKLVVESKKDFPEAHYNLSLLYEDNREMDKAIQHARIAKELSPGSEQFQDHYQRLLDEE